MDDFAIWSALVEWLGTRTGLLVIKGQQSGELPSLPYIMVNFTGANPVREQIQDIEFTETDEVDENGKKKISAAPVIETEWRFSVHGYGNAPTDLLRSIRSAAELNQASEPLFPGLIIHELSQIRNIPEYVNDAWEPRAQMDLYLRGLTKDGVVIDTAEEYSFNIGRA